jgi:hypothetical protein
MTKRELSSLLSQLLPYVNGEKQATALFTVSIEPTGVIMVAATNTASGVMTYQGSYNPYFPIR